MAPWMRQDSIWRRTAALISILAAALLLFGFGVVAELVAGGECMAFDRPVVLALRNPANLGGPLGPPWLQEAARDVTSLGSIVVVTITTLAVVGYLLLSRERAEALWWSPCSAAKSASTAMALAAILTVLIGMSRVYLGVHYPTRVLVGATWALAWWATAAWL